MIGSPRSSTARTTNCCHFSAGTAFAVFRRASASHASNFSWLSTCKARCTRSTSVSSGSLMIVVWFLPATGQNGIERTSSRGLSPVRTRSACASRAGSREKSMTNFRVFRLHPAQRTVPSVPGSPASCRIPPIALRAAENKDVGRVVPATVERLLAEQIDLRQVPGVSAAQLERIEDQIAGFEEIGTELPVTLEYCSEKAAALVRQR